MDYENPKIPEGINVSTTHPLKDFALLVTGVATLFLMVMLCLYLAADYLSPYIPFSAEKKVAGLVLEQYTDTEALSQRDQVIEDYLNEKVQLIAKTQNFPEHMDLTVHYLPNSTVNAFATIGGHLMIHRGLLEKVPNENALIMVLAHEVAHIKHRDPIRALGRGIMLATTMAFFTNASSSGSVHSIFSQAGLLTSLSFGREQEREADREALDSLQALYGHTAGAEDLFTIFMKELGNEPPEWLSSHPLTKDRIEAAREYAEQQSEPMATKPLPEEISDILKNG